MHSAHDDFSTCGANLTNSKIESRWFFNLFKSFVAQRKLQWIDFGRLILLCYLRSQIFFLVSAKEAWRVKCIHEKLHTPIWFLCILISTSRSRYIVWKEILGSTTIMYCTYHQYKKNKSSILHMLVWNQHTYICYINAKITTLIGMIFETSCIQII